MEILKLGTLLMVLLSNVSNIKIRRKLVTYTLQQFAAAVMLSQHAQEGVTTRAPSIQVRQNQNRGRDLLLQWSLSSPSASRYRFQHDRAAEEASRGSLPGLVGSGWLMNVAMKNHSVVATQGAAM